MGRIIIVLLTPLHKCTVIRQNVLVDITNNLLRRNNQPLYCLNYLLIDRLDIVRCLTRRICELSDLICNNCKSLSGFTGTRRLNRCIQRKQVCLAGDTQNIRRQLCNLLHTLRILKSLIHLRCNLADHLIGTVHVLCRRVLKLRRTLLHILRIL